MKQNRETEEHESYGLISASRITSSQRHNFFGSRVKHDSFIKLEIKQADVQRDLNHDYIHESGTIIQVEMTQSQFSEFITSLNMGSGIPCTIKYLAKEGGGIKEMEEPPYKSLLDEFSKEFKQTMRQIVDESTVGLEEIEDILMVKDRMGKKDREKVFKFLKQMLQEFESNVPYMNDQFNRQIDKAVTEAKQTIEAHAVHLALRSGEQARSTVSLPEERSVDPKQLEE